MVKHLYLYINIGGDYEKIINNTELLIILKVGISTTMISCVSEKDEELTKKVEELTVQVQELKKQVEESESQ